MKKILSKENYLKLADNAWIRASLQAIPHVGGSLDTLVFVKAGKWKEARIKEFLDNFAKDMSKLKESMIDKDFLESEEFLSIFEDTVIAIIKEHKKNKRRILKKALVSTIKKEFCAQNSKSFLLEILDSLTIEQIQILKYCYEKHGDRGYDFLRNLKSKEDTDGIIVTFGELQQEFGWKNGSYGKMGLINDLQGRGILFDWSAGRFGYTPFFFALTDLGNELVKSLLENLDEK